MIDWNDNAKAAVEYFADWLRADYNYIANLEDFYNRLPQTKTVADAVEYYGDVWPYSDGVDFMAARSDTGEFFAHGNGYEYRGFEYQVCTRAEFEAYVEEQEKPHFKATRENLEKIAKDAQGDFVEVREKEGEKWTHEYDSANIKCRILATDGDECWVLTEYGNKVTESICSIKPIKPTISTKEYDMLAKYASHLSVDPKEFDQYMIDNYERQLKD